MLTAALEAELARVSAQQHALAVRRAHIEAALLRARQGVDPGIIRATRESKGVVVLARPGAAVGSGT
jgi:hypothetical protein